MKVLLDTHILLWAAADELPPKAASYVEDRENILVFSPASIWEIAIKSGLGRDDFDVDPTLLYNGLLVAGYEELPITGRHALFVKALPVLHKDPFDRILLAQAACESLPFLTADELVAQYGGSAIYVG